MDRRSFLLGLGLTLVVACKRDARCKHCGMKLDPASPWRADLIGDDNSVLMFDTPRCALTSWRSGESKAKSLHVRDYYDRQLRDAEELRFVVGGDVVGPMGPDLVPVDPKQASKFMQDHAGERVVRLDEITSDFLTKMK